jgi:uncharacterized membrane-anchored protein YhcB (DUF1043 family)
LRPLYAKIAEIPETINEKVNGVYAYIDKDVVPPFQALKQAVEESQKKLELSNQSLERHFENVRAVLTGEVRTREEVLRKEMQRLQGSLGELFQKSREQELQDLEDMRRMFTKNLNQLSDVQRSDLDKMKTEFAQSVTKTHEALTRAIDKSVSQLDGKLSTMVKTNVERLENQHLDGMRAVTDAQELHEHSVNTRFVSLREDMVRESKAREESLMIFDDKLQRVQGVVVEDLQNFNRQLSQVEDRVNEHRQELLSTLNERASQLVEDMQYLQKHLSKMLNEGTGSNFARISEARFFALETRLKEEENVRINETVRLDSEVSRIETTIQTVGPAVKEDLQTPRTSGVSPKTTGPAATIVLTPSSVSLPPIDMQSPRRRVVVPGSTATPVASAPGPGLGLAKTTSSLQTPRPLQPSNYH